MKKILSAFLTLVLVFSAFSAMPSVSAAGAAWVIQTSRSSADGSGGGTISYSGFDWDGFGENLVPDPTVAHFEEGVYGTYATPDAQWKPENINPYYWWDKYLEEYNGFTMYKQDMADNGALNYATFGGGYKNNYQSPKARSMPQTAGSLTGDGSGVLRMSSGGGQRAVPIPAMEADKYYVLKMNAKCASNMNSLLELCFETNKDIEIGAATCVGSVSLNSFANNTVGTVCFVIYTGANAYTDPFVRIYCQGSIYTYLDDFAMYEVSEEYATAQTAGTKLDDPPVVTVPSVAYQVSRSGGISGSAISYSGFDWSLLGTNLVPDPTVSHFDAGAGNNQYGRYAKFDGSYNPVAVNQYYWWDKYIDREYGFKKYINDLVNGGDLTLGSLTQDANGYYELVPGTSYGKPSGTLTFNAAVRSPMNWAAIKKNSEYASLTDDGSGVLRFSSTTGAWRTMPLPAMEAEKYYVVKFNMKASNSNNTAVELCLQFDNSNSELGVKAASINLGSGFANNRVDTACFVIYTGSNTYTDPFIKFYCSTETFFDDFGMYEVSEEYAQDQAAGVKLTSPAQYIYGNDWSISSNSSYNGTYLYDYTVYDMPRISETNTYFDSNLITDPGVSDFEAGVYSDGGWWNRMVDTYHGDPATAGNLINSNDNYLWASPKLRELVSSDTSLSHTADGSGAIALSTMASQVGTGTSRREFYLPLAAMDSYSFYVVSFWVHTDTATNISLELYLNSSRGSVLVSNCGESFGAGWHRASTVIYTGSVSPSRPYIKIWDADNTTSDTVLLDDFGHYKLNSTLYGAACRSVNYIIDDSVDFTQTDFLKQDVNGDGRINIFDIRLVRSHIMGNETLTRSLNGDSGVDIKDYVNSKLYFVSTGI